VFVGPSPTWFVLFSGEDRRTHLIDYISPKDFLHCCAFFFDPQGERWCVYDVNRGGVAIAAMPPEVFDVWIMRMKQERGGRVLKVDWKSRRRPPIQIGMWCVVAVRYAIGCRSLALRPIGLWRDLLKEGAQEVFV